MSRFQETIDKVKHLAHKELEYCSPVDTPYLCNFIKTDNGLESAVTLIIELFGKRGFSITRAIAQIEQSMNPNLNAR